MNNPYYVECPVKNALSIRSLYTFFRKQIPRDYNFKGESHDFHEILCVMSGEVGVTADKNVYQLPAGQAIFHRGGEFHSLWSDLGSASEIIVFSFTADEFPESDKHIFSLSAQQLAEISSIFSAAQKAFILDGPRVMYAREGKAAEASAVVKRLELFVLTLFTEAFEARHKIAGRSAENYARIVSVLETHVSNDLCAAQIAELCNLSIPALNKTVARYAGCGVMSYYGELRLKKAEELLLGGASVKETAISVGFDNQNYFSAWFKKRKGIPPSRIKD